jgi:hypothetical protein
VVLVIEDGDLEMLSQMVAETMENLVGIRGMTTECPAPWGNLSPMQASTKTVSLKGLRAVFMGTDLPISVHGTMHETLLWYLLWPAHHIFVRVKT